MNKPYLEQLVNEGLSTREIGSIVGLKQTPVRYWLKKYGLKTKKRSLPKIFEGGEKRCPRCKETKDYSLFYKRRSGKEPSVYCRSCTSDQTLERMRAFKERCLEFCGNNCAICGYNKYVGALEFHHLNISEKEFSIANLKSYSFSEVVKQELSKCITLCSNCHREVHAGLTPVPELPSKQ